MQSPRWVVLVGVAAISFCSSAPFTLAQEPPPPSTPAQAAPVGSWSSSKEAKNQKSSHANDFLIIGTVFDAKGYAFPGAELRIRRSTEKKFRWDSYTNSRGEFAMRVPQGSDYEMIVHAKGFEDQARTMDAKTGLSEARIVFRMEPTKEEKK
jgi:Carboxypeptidase regulatory-like domain